MYDWSKQIVWRSGNAGMLAAVVLAAGLAATQRHRSQRHLAPVSRPDNSHRLAGDLGWELLQAAAQYQQGQREDAAKAFERIVLRDPKNVTALYFLGLYHMDLGLKARAQEGQQKSESPEEQAFRQLAQNELTLARDYLLKLLEPGVKPVEAGLLLAQADMVRKDPATEQKYLEEAIEVLEKYTQSAPDDYLGHFFLGIAFFRQSCATWASSQTQRAAKEGAEREFDRVREYLDVQTGVASEERDAVKIYLTYYEGAVELRKASDGSGSFDIAQEKFEEVESRAAGVGGEMSGLRDQASYLAKQARTAAPTYAPLEFLKPPIGPLEFRGGLAFGAGYDSNVSLTGLNTLPPPGIRSLGDWYADVFAGVEVSRRFTRARENLSFAESLRFGIGADTTDVWHPSIKEYDINQYRGRAFVEWEMPRDSALHDVVLYLEYIFSNTQLGQAPFVDSNGGFLGATKYWRRAEYPESVGTRTDLYYSYEYRNYSDFIPTPVLDRDGNYHLFGARQAFDLVRADRMWGDYYAGKPAESPEKRFDSLRWLNVYFGYEFEKDVTQGTEFDMYSNGLLAGVWVPLPWRLAADFTFGMTWDNYANPSVYDYRLNSQYDFYQLYSLGLSYTIIARGELEQLPTLQMGVRGFVNLSNQDSNIVDNLREEVYSYDRTVAGLQFRLAF